MPRIECYVSDALKEKIGQLASAKSVPVSKYIANILEANCGDDTHPTSVAHDAIFQKKVMAALCDIYACVLNPATPIQDENYAAAVERFQEIKRQCEEVVAV